METLEQKIAKRLLQINAIKFNPANPYQWTSGWNSPIYCDNRKILSYPDLRSQVRDGFVQLINEYYSKPDVIAGVATGSIAIAALTAEKLELPFVYVRSSPKKHGLKNLIEGVIKPNQKVVVIEDLISTGMSSLNAVKALREQDIKIMGMGAIFSYNFDIATKNFDEYNCPLKTLTNYNNLIRTAVAEGYIKESDLAELEQWRKDPANWKKEKK
ncbi:MAG: orotate phosphoribosyltransferase [Bacteroidales bacterium]